MSNSPKCTNLGPGRYVYGYWEIDAALNGERVGSHKWRGLRHNGGGEPTIVWGPTLKSILEQINGQEGRK